MTETSSSLHPNLWPDINNATSSPESEAGRLPCDSQDGPMIEKHGPLPVPVSLFRAPAGGGDLLTSATSGLSFSRLSPSEILKLSLASRLLPRLDYFGSIEYTLTWKARVTPSQRSIFALRASQRRISVNDCIGWPTVCHNEATAEIDPEKWTAQKAERRKRVKELQKKGLLTPGSGRGTTLAAAAAITGWCTVSSRDWKDSPGMATEGKNPDGSIRKRIDQLPRLAAICGYPTPVCSDAKGPSGRTSNITTVSKIMGYPTPNAWDAQGSHGGGQGASLRIGAQEMTHGEKRSSDTGKTGPRGALNPEFCRWLMGFPAEWAKSAVTVTRSSRRSPQNL